MDNYDTSKNIATNRTLKLKKNIIGSIALKFSMLLIELLKVPILLSYLSNEKYGIWLTIVSIVLWTQHFDLGLGSGLRFRITESLAKNEHEKVKKSWSVPLTPLWL